MTKILSHLLAFSVLFLAMTQVAFAKDDISVHVLTMGPGRHLFTRFGHIALMVEDETKHKKRVYNFGEFDYQDPYMVPKFVAGRLLYHLDISSFKKLLKHYRRVDRELTIQTLDLTDVQTQNLLERLDKLSRPENLHYKYQHFTNNCCTKVRDLLNDATDGALAENSPKAEHTYRYWIESSLKQLPLYKYALMFLFGSVSDRPISKWEEKFFPEVLSLSLDEVRLAPDSRLLVKEKRVLNKRRGLDLDSSLVVVQYMAMWGFGAFLFLCFAVATLYPAGRLSSRFFGIGLIFWGIVAGLGGGSILFLWTMTKHVPSYYNENLLIFPFLHFWLVVPGAALLRNRPLGIRMHKMLSWYLIGSLGLVGLDAVLKLGPFYQDNSTFIWVAVAMNVPALAAVKRSLQISQSH
jgi:Domain of unknown function (DUF4105)